MQRFLLAAFLFLSGGLSAQVVDSFRVYDHSFVYEVPAGWKKNRKPGAVNKVPWSADLLNVRKDRCGTDSLRLRVVTACRDCLGDSLAHASSEKDKRAGERRAHDRYQWTDVIERLPASNFVGESYRPVCGKLIEYVVAIDVIINDTLHAQLYAYRRDIPGRRATFIREMESYMVSFLAYNKAYLDPLKKEIPEVVPEPPALKVDNRPFLLLRGDTLRYFVPEGWILASADTFFSVDTVPYFLEVKLVPLDTALAKKVFMTARVEKKSMVVESQSNEYSINGVKLGAFDNKALFDLQITPPKGMETRSEITAKGQTLIDYSREKYFFIYFDNYHLVRCMLDVKKVSEEKEQALLVGFSEFINGISD